MDILKLINHSKMLGDKTETSEREFWIELKKNDLNMVDKLIETQDSFSDKQFKEEISSNSMFYFILKVIEDQIKLVKFTTENMA